MYSCAQATAVDRGDLVRSHAELEVIFQYASIGILFTRNRVITHVNPKLESLFGRAPGSLLDQPASTLFTSDDDYARFSAAVRGKLALGQSVELDWGFRDQAGNELMCRVRAQAVNPSPNDEGTVWLVEDITLETRQARALNRYMVEFEAIMKNAPIGILFTVNRRVTRANDIFCTMFGYTQDQVPGLAGRQLFPSDEVYAEIGRVASPALSAGRPVTHEMPMARSDGSILWVQVVAYVVDPADTRSGTIWLLSDRTEHKAREESMRRASFENQALLDNAVVGIVFLRNRIIERCNPQFERIFGYAPGTAVGRCTREWFVSEEEFRAVGREIYGEIARGSAVIREHHFIKQDGEHFWCRMAGRVADVDRPVEGGSIWVIEDTTERHLAEEALAGATTLMQGVFNSAGVSIITTLPDGTIRLMNHAAEQWLGYAAADLVGIENVAMIHDAAELQDFADRHNQDTGERVCGGFEAIAARARLSGTNECEWHYIRSDGGRFPVHLTVSALRDQTEGISGYVCVAIDITDRRLADEAVRLSRMDLEMRVKDRTAELAEANQLMRLEVIEREQIEAAMRRMAHYDALTCLPNRNLLQDRAAQALERARQSGAQVGLMFIDLDRFKNINDSLGHDVGDRLLIQVAGRLSEIIEEDDTLARLGGDEFVLLLPNVTGYDGLAATAGQIVELLSMSFPIDRHLLHVTPSIGICCFPDDGDSIETLMRNADTAMYRAKADGRNGYRFFTGSMNRDADERFQIESALRTALRGDEFSVLYQPLIDASSGKIWGMEALLRWRSGTLGVVGPDRFIPVAEESGTIVEIGHWVLMRACREARVLRDRGHTGLTLAVNLSPLQFRQKGLISMIRRALEVSGLPAHCLELEITESSLIHDVDAVIATLQGLREIGVRLAIDDFGTGYSSLSYLKSFPVHKLKIDRSFVKDLETDAQSLGIVSAVVGLAQSLRLSALAEGVETAEQRDRLLALGCGFMQGYLFSRPLSLKDLQAYLER